MRSRAPNPVASLRPEQPGPVADSGTVAIHTHGCKLNQADSNVLARQFQAAGYRLVDSVVEADVFVLNTCTVTANADAKARQALRAARRRNPRAFIVAAGCYPQRAEPELTRMEAVSLVVGNSEKDRLVSLVLAARGQASNLPLSDQTPLPLTLTPPQTGRSRAMLKIQEGCNQVCAYCIVPKVRGREQSIHPDVLVGQIQQRAAEGFQEVVLTGTQLGSYGFDIPGTSLRKLLRRILAETEIPRLRVSSLQPQEISPALLDLYQDSRLCPHFHIPLQSGSDPILRAMRRRYNTELFARTVDLVRCALPGAGITADLILGFPGEGSAEYAETRDFVSAIGFSDLHIFPYSRRPGTSAAYLPEQVPEPVKKERVTEMLQVARQGFEAFRQQQVGQVRPVLWESKRRALHKSVLNGLTDNYIRVHAESGPDLSNVIAPARLLELEGDSVRTGIV
ncbi:MAG: tRNA (N(6)-L-threonylcarbamoyladenosine(37)-C(2))-methylthiotransferase MtaB [Dehalococcoidia bacterium]